jgi:hypothetical protein
VIQALPKAGATRTSEIREEFEETKEWKQRSQYRREKSTVMWGRK